MTLRSAVSRIAALVLVAVAIGVLALNLFIAPPVHEPYNPLRYVVPQQVLSEGPHRAGATIVTKAIKCNDDDEPVGIIGNSDYRQTTTGATPIVSARGTVPLIIGPGECLERVFTTTLPGNMTPGIWRRQGNDCIIPDFKVCRAWFTEEIEVIR